MVINNSHTQAKIMKLYLDYYKYSLIIQIWTH